MVTATVAVVSARNATWLVSIALTAMNGAESVNVASSFGTTIRQRGIGVSVRFARVRSSISFEKAAAAMASTMRGAMDPASMALSTAVSNSTMVGACRDCSVRTEMITGMAASTVMMKSRQRLDSWRSVSR
jgi:hypothetical protein